MRFDFYNWLSGAYLDILVILAILGMAIFRWWNIRYEIQEDGILFSKGLIVNEDFFIPFKSMSSVTAKRALPFRPFKAVIIYVETDSILAVEKPSEPDVKFIVSLTEYKTLYNKIPIDKNDTVQTYRAPKAQLLLYSFVFSSSLSGLIYFGTFLIQSGRLVSTELEKRFVEAVNDVTYFAGKLIEGLTPVTVALIIILGAGWFISFVSNYLHMISFRVQRRGKSIFIKNGFFSKWKYYINTERINYADIRQNLLMKICRVMSVQISCTGYGKSNSETPVFVPITTKKSVMGVMKLLLPEYEPRETTVQPRWNYIMRFMGPPAVLIFAVIILAAAMVMIFPQWYSVILFAAIMCEVWSVQLLLVKFVAYYTNGVGYEDGVLCLSYC
ncbi:MAG: PH domain-containing protein, partial [Oscillospiraceae bacterium]